MALIPLVETSNISKAFPGVQALNNVSVTFFSGEIHAIIGENGAGKSTLLKIISGVYQKDEGSIKIKGEPIEFSGVRQAKSMGISVIHQEFSLIPDLTVAQNLCLGNEPVMGKTGLIDKKALIKLAEKYMTSTGLIIDPNTRICNLSCADRQMVEITRAVSQNAEIIIMDEPTSSLSNAEVEILFSLIRKLKSLGVCIVYISHRMSEVLELADRITVMRDGEVIQTIDAKSSNEKQLIKLMVGREIVDFFGRKDHEIGEPVLEVRDFSNNCFSDISFDLRRGEILGICGLIGSGRTELVRAIFGADKIDKGELKLFGKKVVLSTPREAIESGLGLVPEDRKLQGLILDFSVRANVALPSVKAKSIYGFVNRRWGKTTCAEYIKKLRIKTPLDSTITKTLSGGNQQKVVIAKWLAAMTKILLLDEPTRGIDVNAKSEIYELMNTFVRDGGSIIMVSSELPEILGVSDRVIVMREGRISGVLNTRQATEEQIMALASPISNHN